MGKIWRIARLELSIFFNSPVAWLLLVVFMVQAGLVFTDLLGARIAVQQLGAEQPSFTQDIFGGGSGFFATMQRHLYLYIPLLTMGLLSRETGSGSIKLLASSPVTMRQVVFGKYLSMLVFGLLLIAILSLFVAIAVWAIPHVDIGYAAGALLGVYLLVAAYAAIGLYVSSLTPYQVIAAIGTLAVLAGLNYVGEVGRGIEVVRDITHWFSIRGRTGYFLKGLLSTKEICYFLLVITLFVALAIMQLQSGRSRLSAVGRTARYVLLLVAVVAVGFGSSRPGLVRYADVTRYGTQSYTERSEAVIAQVTGPVRLTTYVNLLGHLAHIGSPRFRNFDRSNLEQIRRYLPRLQLDYVYFYDTTDTQLDPNMPLREQALRRATAHGFDFADVLPPEAIRRRIDLSPERNQFVRMLAYDGRVTPLRMYHDIEAYPGESEVIAALKRLLHGPFVVGVLTGHGERSSHREGDKDYHTLMTARNARTAWINQGADVLSLDADSPRLHADSLGLLIIADPLVPYTPQQLAAIRRYIDAGGNLLLAAEPHRQEALNPIGQAFGVSFSTGTLLQDGTEYEPDLIVAQFAADSGSTGFRRPRDTVVTMPGAVGLVFRDTAGFTARPVLHTDERHTWNETRPFNLKVGEVRYDSARQRKERAAVALAVSRRLPHRQQRIFVAGDADFLSKGELARYNIQAGNADLGIQLLRWFSYGEYPPDTNRPRPIDNRIRISKPQIAATRAVIVLALPALLAGVGAFTIIRRKRK